MTSMSPVETVNTIPGLMAQHCVIENPTPKGPMTHWHVIDISDLKNSLSLDFDSTKCARVPLKSPVHAWVGMSDS